MADSAFALPIADVPSVPIPDLSRGEGMLHLLVLAGCGLVTVAWIAFLGWAFFEMVVITVA
jgi:hypothetical protein